MQNKKYFLVALALIVFLGAGLRIYNLGENSFDRDEFFELNSSYGYFKTGDWVAWDFGNKKPFSGKLQDETSTERAEIYRWQLAQVYKFFEPTESSTRAVSVFWGLLSIVVVYFIALYFTGNYWIALLAAFLIAIGESGIVYSRRLRMYSMLFPVYLIFSWLVYQFYEAKYVGKNKFFKLIADKFNVNFLYLLPALIAGFISYNVHMLTVNIIFVALAFSFLGWIIWEKKNKINKYSITIAIFFIAYLAVSQLPDLAKFYKSFKKQVALFEFNPRYFFDYFNDFSLPVVAFIFALIGVWYLFKKLGRKKEAVFLFISAFVPLMFAIFTWVRTPSERYIYFIQSFGMILLASGVYAVAIYILSRFGKKGKIAMIVFLVAFLALIDFSYFKKENQVYLHTKNAYYPDFRNIFPYILENKKNGDILVTRAYRSYYWHGDDVKILDLQTLPFEKKDCLEFMKKIIAENPSGLFVLPKIDEVFVCKIGRDYLRENLEEVENKNIPTSISIYRWGE
ncbi:MAG: hypothetical protein WC678_03340 [Parcubacteria group bacterium]|jgi:4-amino-4-deoxy-L-arabinose transferase-like glycosyltransferase